MQNTHDPYLQTVKREIRDKETQKKRQRYVKSRPNSNGSGFLSQTINLSDYYFLPEGVQNFIAFILFILIPYSVGTFFTIFIINSMNLSTYQTTGANSFLFAWVIGYEIIASILLLLIIKSAIFYQSESMIK